MRTTANACTFARLHPWCALRAVRFITIAFVWLALGLPAKAADRPALSEARPRVIVSTDIGGTDPDDFQSMVHLLLYADVLELEGLISSPYGPGRKEDILKVIDAYESDYQKLRRHSTTYPTPAALRLMTKEGAIDPAPHAGFRDSTEGSSWIIDCARQEDLRPLHVLVWGGIEDLAQALHDAPDILPKLRVYYIDGPNKKWGPDAYHYIASNHPRLWIIEANSTYRGFFLGGNQNGEWSNAGFVARHVPKKSSLANFFAAQLNGVIKMGDTPSVCWLLQGRFDEPGSPGWGGRFVRAWNRPYVKFSRLTTAEDQTELFGIVELVLSTGADASRAPEGRLEMENQIIKGHVDDQGNIRFRFCPRDPKVFRYTIRSNLPDLDGKTGEITSVAPVPSAALQPSNEFPNWWTDDPSPEVSEGIHHGARSISQWREDYLRDFARRFARGE